MPRSFLSLPALTLTGILYLFAPAGSGTPVPQAAVLEIDDFNYVDTSGEPTNAGTPHQTKLQAFMTALRRDFGPDDRYLLALSSCIAPCTAQGSVTLIGFAPPPKPAQTF
jgi:hypothetical protein